MKKILFVMALLMAGVSSANAASAYTFPATIYKVTQGQTVRIPVQLAMDQENKWKTTQMYVSFSTPSGLSISNFEADATRLADAVANWDVKNFGKSVGIVGTKPTSFLTGASGVVAYITIAADGGLATGTYTMSFASNTFLGDGDNKEFPNVSAASVNIEVIDYAILDENETAAPANYTGNVQVNRTLKADVWNTICLPFAVANPTTVFGAGTQVADFTGVTDGDDAASGDGLESLTINFATATTMEANHPYMIKVPAAMTQFNVSGVTVAAEDEPNVACDKVKKLYNYFCGTYVCPTTIPEADDETTYIFMQNNNFVASDGTATLKAFRGYFMFEVSVLSPTAYAASPVKAITFDIDGVETGIESIEGFENANEGWYDLNGRKLGVKPAAKGIYINNGKKVVTK